MAATDRPRLFLPGLDLLALCQEAFARGEAVRMPVEGVSMSPWLLPGDIVRVEAASLADLRVGQVALGDRGGRIVMHQFVARANTGKGLSLVLRAISTNTLEAIMAGEKVIGRVASVERDGEVRQLDRLPLDLTSRIKAKWGLLLHGRVGDGSWVRRIPRRLLAGPRWLLSAAIAGAGRLRRVPVAGRLMRWLWPTLYGRVRIMRLVRRIALDNESYVLEAYFGRRKVGSAHLAQMMQPLGWETWWVGIEVHALYRQRGVGSQLIEELGAWANELGIGPGYAAIRDDNIASLTLFHRSGWERTADAEMERLASEYYSSHSSRPWTTHILIQPDA